MPLEDRLSGILQIRRACNLDNRVLVSARGNLAAIWAPPDFGQARMAALGWLVSLAQKQGKANADAVAAEVRQAAEKTPADPRALWDWFYLGALQYDNPAVLAAGRALSRATPADPLALWAYLYAIGSRQLGTGQRSYVSQGQEANDTTPALAGDELEHLLTCYRSLRTRRPELAQAQVLQTVAAELKRAGRVDDAEAFYREAVGGATQLGQIASVFGMAAQRGDVEALIQLSDRYDRLQTGRGNAYYSTGTFYFGGPADAIGQAMSFRAGMKAYDDVLRLLDHELAAVRRKQERQSSGASRAARSRFGSQAVVQQYQIWVGKTSRYMQITFPTPNEYFDANAIQLLRTAFELYKRDDLSSDLVGHFRRQAEAARTPADAVYPRLALSSLYWWNDEKDEAIAEFTKVAEASKSESDLRLDLAELLEQQGRRADALSLADAVQPLDNTTMKRREELALRLSVMTGDLDRARQAAERLFGLRLDTDTQVRLSGQMHQLGLHELAEAVLGRARRRAGNKATALVGMMLQYQSQGKLDVAVQVAMQILHSTTATRQMNINVASAEDPDASRSSAIAVLARSGRLPQLIDKVQEQLKKTPNAIQLHQALADYYKAAGQRDQARAELARMIELRPEDNNLRLQVAQQLVQDGQAAAALDHYRIIVKRDPALVAPRFTEILRAFQQARKLDELIGLLEEIDLRQLGRPAVVYNTINNLLALDSKQRDRVMPLVRKAWDAFPDNRATFLTYLRRDELWQMPETFDYATESIVPGPSTFAPATQWTALGRVLSYSNDGRMTTILSRLLDMAGSQGRLEELGARIDAARKAVPGWTAGPVMRALIDLRLGRHDQARSAIRQFLETSKNESIPTVVFGVIGAELEGHTTTRDLAIATYETGISREADDPSTISRLGYGPANRLVTLYTRENRREDARRILLGSGKPGNTNGVIYPEGYLEQMRMQSLGTAAAQLLELGFAADAVALYSESLNVAREITPDGSNYIGNLKMLTRQYRDGLTRAIEKLKPDDLAATLARTLRDEAKGNDPKKPGDRVSASAGAKPRDQVLDLMVMVHPRELDKATLRSLMADAIAPASTSPGQTKGREQLAAAMEDLRRKHPDDLSVAIAEALLAIGTGDDPRIETALDRLGRLVEKTPLDPLPDGARANARQRAEASRQVPLWLVARACWKRKDAVKMAGIADRLADRALEAARRLAENQTRLAMLRERGEVLLAQGDRKAAEAAWRRMLAIVVEADRPKANPAKPKPPASVPTPASLKPRATSMRHQSLPPLEKGGPGGVPGTRHEVTFRATIRRASFQPEKTAPKAKAKATSKAKAAPPAQDNPPRTKSASTASRRPAASPRTGLPILTLERFEQAMQIARLAAEHDMPELSLDAVRESLRAGPPVVPATAPSSSSRLIVRQVRGLDDSATDPVSSRVVASMIELVRLWKKHHVPPELIYQALREAVLPQARPTEIFLYAQAVDVNSSLRPQSVGSLLAAVAVRAGKVEDLSKALATRRGQPMAELPAAILATQIAIAAGDPAGVSQSLQAIAARLKNDSSRASAELAWHAALPALNHPSEEVSASATDVLDGCVPGLEAASSAQGEPLGTLLILMARRRFRLGDAPGGRKRLDAYLEVMEKATTRYSGDYPLYLRKHQLQRVAGELARAGLWSDAMAQLARYFDAPAYSGGDPPIDDVLVRLMQRMAALPARERYDAMRAWTMPTKDRRAVRLLTSMAGLDPAPDVFAPAAPRPLSRPQPVDRATRQDPVSTATALIDAAREAGILDQLAEEARTAAEPSGAQAVENAEVLHLLVELARGQGSKVAPRIEARLAGLIKENEAHPAEPPAQPGTVVRTAVSQAERVKFPWTDYLLARAAVRAGEPIGGLGLRMTRALVDRAARINDYALSAIMRGDLAEALARRSGATAIQRPGLASWQATDMRPGYYLSTGEPAPWWIAHQGHVVHPAGSTTDLLLFDYPLAGSYEFSADAYTDPGAHSLVAHNGISFLPSRVENMGGVAELLTIGHTENLHIPWSLSRPKGFNRLAIQATPQKVPRAGQRPPLPRGRRPQPDQSLDRPDHLPRAQLGLEKPRDPGHADHPARGPAQPRRSARRLGLQLLPGDPASALERHARPVRQRAQRPFDSFLTRWHQRDDAVASQESQGAHQAR